MKKFVSLLLALVMIVAMSTTVFAAEDEAETFALTIAGILGHKYNVYQIYTGDVAEEDGTLVLSNVKYGQNHYPSVDGATGDPVPNAELQDFINSQDPANYFRTQLNGDPYAVVNPDCTESSVTISVEAGYYLIVDVTEDLPDGQTKSPIILKVAEATTVTSKHATIISTKKVDDKNDSTTDEDNRNWVDSADYDFGDDIPFQLTVTLPATLNAYDSYELTFHDKQAAGLDDPENFNVYIADAQDKAKIQIPNAADGTNGYTVESCTSETCEYGGCSFTVKVGDIIALYGETEFAVGDKIIVEYTAKLNEDANVGRAGNENSMYVCHPDGHTPKDDVTVLTYELKVNKIDGTSKEALKGAGFTLQKWIEAKSEWVNVGDEIVGNDTTSFIWSGIDGGKYKLVETTTPAGYNTIADIEFVINATHKDVWLADGNYALEDVIAKVPSGDSVVFADKNAEGLLDGKLEGNVENFKGVVLPETGAEGTFFLLTGSALLIMVAAVFMITRKKMSVYED